MSSPSLADAQVEEAIADIMRAAGGNTQLVRQTQARVFAEDGDFEGFCKLIGYEPHSGGQEEIHRDRRIVRVITSGRRWGKTELAAAEGAFVILRGGLVWVVANSHINKMRLWKRLTGILCDSLGFKPDKHTHNPQGYCYLSFSWGGWAEGYSTKGEGAESIVGEAVDLILWDEAAKSPDWVWGRRLEPNLVGAKHQGRALITSTPEGYNHFYELWQLGKSSEEADYGSWRFKTEDNPHLDPAAIERARRTCTPETFAQEWEGDFTTFAGQVYKEFDWDIHVPEKRIEYDDALPLYLTFDFGTTNPWVCLWIQTTADDTVRIIDEYYQTGQTTTENGHAVIDYHVGMGYKEPTWFSADPSGRDDILTLQRHVGIRAHHREMSRQRREVAWGIETIRRLLMRRPGYDGQPGPPGMFVSSKCTETIREFEQYRYPEVKAEQNAKEDPVKDNDHCMDALRYFVACWYARGAEARETRRRLIAARPGKPVRPALERLWERHERMVAGGR